MKHVLIVCFALPPANAPAARRLWNWALALRKEGATVTILTRQYAGTFHESRYKSGFSEALVVEEQDGIQILRAPVQINQTDLSWLQRKVATGYETAAAGTLKKKLLFNFASLFLPLGYHWRWKFKASEVDQHLSVKPDLVLASGDPWMIFEYGKRLATHFKAKYVADYRDPWNIVDESIRWEGWGDYGDGLLGRLKLRRNLQLERRFNGSADGIISVSEPILKNCETINQPKASECITNAFNPAESSTVEGNEIPRNGKLNLAFTGTIWNGQNVALLIDALDELCKEDPTVVDLLEFTLIGTDISTGQKHLAAVKAFPHQQMFTHKFEFVPREQAYQIKHRADVLLFFAFEGTQGVYSSKLFEYLGFRKPILCVGTDHSSVEALMEKTQVGYLAADQTTLVNSLRKLCQEWRDAQTLTFTPNESEVNQYSYAFTGKKTGSVSKSGNGILKLKR